MRFYLVCGTQNLYTQILDKVPLVKEKGLAKFDRDCSKIGVLQRLGV